MTPDKPRHIDIRRDTGLTLTWPDGSTSFYPVGHLRRMSPSADMREMREEMERNPLTVLPDRYAHSGGEKLTIADAEFVGNYALRLRFSDGHDTGIYSWQYLREIEPRG